MLFADPVLVIPTWLLMILGGVVSLVVAIVVGRLSDRYSFSDWGAVLEILAAIFYVGGVVVIVLGLVTLLFIFT